MIDRPRLAGCSLLVLVLLLFSGDGLRAQGQEHEVVFTVDTESGRITVRPDTVVAQRGDRIRFVGEGVDSWTVTFDDGSPFANREITGTGAQAFPILPQAAHRGYKYEVSVTVGENEWSVDPEIIVRPPGETIPAG